MAAEARIDVHHFAPRCLLALFDAAAGGIADRSEFDAEVELEALTRHRAGSLKRAGSGDPPPAYIIMVSAYTIREGGGW